MPHYFDTSFLDYYQELLSRISFFDDYQELLSRINETGQNIIEPITNVAHINQEIVDHLNTSFERIAYMFTQDFDAVYKNILSPHIEQLHCITDFNNVFSPNHLETINNISSITEPLIDAFHSIDFDVFLTSVQTKAIVGNSDDYITTDSPVINELDISNSIAIHIGHNRIKMATGDFIALLALIFTIFAYCFPRANNETPSESETEVQNMVTFSNVKTSSPENTNLLLQEQNRLLQEQNQILLEILESVDTSESSQAEFFKDIKESLQEQAALFQMYMKTSEVNELSPDNPHKSAEPCLLIPDAVQEEDCSTQVADDSTQPAIDISPASPDTGHDNE